MSWRTTDTVQQRQNMIKDYLSRMYTKSELSVRYEVSRVTIDHWIKRFEAEGFPGLEERSRTPHSSPERTDPECEQLLVHTREKHPQWGPITLRARLARTHPQVELPAASTIGAILKRHGLITSQHHSRRPNQEVAKPKLGEITEPNQVWNIDFKGEFLLGEGGYCYPLTLSDTYSRYLLCVAGCSSTAGEPTRQHLERVFASYGLPEAIRSDNGTPFVGNGLWGLSRLNIWWRKLGIRHIRTRPGCPQDNGQHERMHRTLKAETTRPPKPTMVTQQARFDEYRLEFIEERTHQGIGNATPSQLYRPSARQLPAKLEQAEYPGHYEVRTVSSNGTIKFGNQVIFLSETLEHERIGLCEIEDQLWSIYLFTELLGRLDMRTVTVR